jgi:hypothetical protein
MIFNSGLSISATFLFVVLVFVHLRLIRTPPSSITLNQVVKVIDTGDKVEEAVKSAHFFDEGVFQINTNDNNDNNNNIAHTSLQLQQQTIPFDQSLYYVTPLALRQRLEKEHLDDLQNDQHRNQLPQTTQTTLPPSPSLPRITPSTFYGLAWASFIVGLVNVASLIAMGAANYRLYVKAHNIAATLYIASGGLYQILYTALSVRYLYPINLTLWESDQRSGLEGNVSAIIGKEYFGTLKSGRILSIVRILFCLLSNFSLVLMAVPAYIDHKRQELKLMLLRATPISVNIKFVNQNVNKNTGRGRRTHLVNIPETNEEVINFETVENNTNQTIDEKKDNKNKIPTRVGSYKHTNSHSEVHLVSLGSVTPADDDTVNNNHKTAQNDRLSAVGNNNPNNYSKNNNNNNNNNNNTNPTHNFPPDLKTSPLIQRSMSYDVENTSGTDIYQPNTDLINHTRPLSSSVSTKTQHNFENNPQNLELNQNIPSNPDNFSTELAPTFRNDMNEPVQTAAVERVNENTVVTVFGCIKITTKSVLQMKLWAVLQYIALTSTVVWFGLFSFEMGEYCIVY